MKLPARGHSLGARQCKWWPSDSTQAALYFITGICHSDAQIAASPHRTNTSQFGLTSLSTLEHLRLLIKSKMTKEPASVGFIGLGTMGLPMAENLISKLPSGSKMYVYDIFEDAVRKFKAQHPDAVVPCGSAREATEHSVSLPSLIACELYTRLALTQFPRLPCLLWFRKALMFARLSWTKRTGY